MRVSKIREKPKLPQLVIHLAPDEVVPSRLGVQARCAIDPVAREILEIVQVPRK